MNYYIRENFDSPIEGPYSPDEIRFQIGVGRATLDWLATGDLREPRSQIEQSPKRDWVPIRSIHDLSGQLMTEAVGQTAGHDSDPDKSAGCLRAVIITVVVIVSLLMFLFGLIYAGCHGQRIN